MQQKAVDVVSPGNCTLGDRTGTLSQSIAACAPPCGIRRAANEVGETPGASTRWIEPRFSADRTIRVAANQRVLISEIELELRSCSDLQPTPPLLGLGWTPIPTGGGGQLVPCGLCSDGLINELVDTRIVVCAFSREQEMRTSQTRI